MRILIIALPEVPFLISWKHSVVMPAPGASAAASASCLRFAETRLSYLGAAGRAPATGAAPDLHADAQSLLLQGV